MEIIIKAIDKASDVADKGKANSPEWVIRPVTP